MFEFVFGRKYFENGCFYNNTFVLKEPILSRSNPNKINFFQTSSYILRYNKIITKMVIHFIIEYTKHETNDLVVNILKIEDLT